MSAIGTDLAEFTAARLRWRGLSNGVRIVPMRVASLALERTRDSLLESSSGTSEGASETVGRRFRLRIEVERWFRPVRNTAPRAPGGGFVQGSCDSLDIYGDAVTVSSGGTSVRLAVPEAGIPDALCPAEGVRWWFAERRRGDRQSRNALANLR